MELNGPVPDDATGPLASTTTGWRSRWRSPDATRRLGRLMIGVGVAGAIIAVSGTVIGWIFVGQVATASDDSLAVTLQSLDAIDDTIDLADDVLVSTADGVIALAGTLGAVSGSFDAGTQAIDDIAELAVTIGPSLEDAGGTVRNLERIGNDIDAVLGALSNIPLAPDYDPAAGLGETFGQLADTLETLPGQLETTAGSLTEFTGSAGELQEQLDDLADSVRSISSDLDDTGDLVEQYRASVADARRLALATNNDLDNGVVLMRILLLFGGVTLLLGQVIPLWLGRSLLDEADDPVVRRSDASSAASP
jgi:methyl-accepting chemotaxis protein